MKKLGIAIALVGFVAFWMGAEGSDTGMDEKQWMAATIIGVLLMVLGTLVHQYPIYLQQERARKSIRYRRYLELQEKMSTQEVVYVKRKAHDKKNGSRVTKTTYRTWSKRNEQNKRIGSTCRRLYKTLSHMTQNTHLQGSR